MMSISELSYNTQLETRAHINLATAVSVVGLNFTKLTALNMLN
jgi:hypothetical protein